MPVASTAYLVKQKSASSTVFTLPLMLWAHLELDVLTLTFVFYVVSRVSTVCKFDIFTTVPCMFTVMTSTECNTAIILFYILQQVHCIQIDEVLHNHLLAFTLCSLQWHCYFDQLYWRVCVNAKFNLMRLLMRQRSTTTK